MRCSRFRLIMAVAVCLTAGGSRAANADWTASDHYCEWVSGSGSIWELESDGGVLAAVTLSGSSPVTDGGEYDVCRDFTEESPSDDLDVQLYAAISGYASVDAGAAGTAYCDIDATADGTTGDFPNSRRLQQGPYQASAPTGTPTRSISDNQGGDLVADRTTTIGASGTLRAFARAYATGQRSGTGSGGGSASALIQLGVS